MVLVVISVQFSETKERESRLMANENRVNNPSSPSSVSIVGKKNMWEELLLAIGRAFKSIVKKIFCIKIGGNNHKRYRGWEFSSSRETTSLQVLFCCCYNSLNSSKAFKLAFEVRDKVRELVESQKFQNFILGSIVVNSAFMAFEHHNQVIPIKSQ